MAAKSVLTLILLASVAGTFVEHFSLLLTMGKILASLLSVTLLSSLHHTGYAHRSPKKYHIASKARDRTPREIRNGIRMPKSSSLLAPILAEDVPITVQGIKFGVGFGISTYLQNVYSYTLVAPNYALSKERISPIAGVASGVVIFNKSVSYLNRAGETYTQAYPLSLLLAVNLGAFGTNATSSASGFNTRLDLGVGVGYRFSQTVQIGLFLDLTSQRFLREAYDQYEGKPVPTFVANQNLTALDLTDDRYFINQTVPSLSLKAVFNLTSEQPSEQKITKAQAFATAKNSFR